MIGNSPLANVTKKITNHSALKTLVKKLKSHQLPKSDIICITGHNSEAGLDAYDSDHEVQQQWISHAIDNDRLLSKTLPAVSINNRTYLS